MMKPKRKPVKWVKMKGWALVRGKNITANTNRYYLGDGAAPCYILVRKEDLK